MDQPHTQAGNAMKQAPAPNTRVQIDAPHCEAHGKVGWFIDTNEWERELEAACGGIAPDLIWHVDTPVGDDDIDHWWLYPHEVIILE